MCCGSFNWFRLLSESTNMYYTDRQRDTSSPSKSTHLRQKIRWRQGTISTLSRVFMIHTTGDALGALGNGLELKSFRFSLCTYGQLLKDHKVSYWITPPHTLRCYATSSLYCNVTKAKITKRTQNRNSRKMSLLASEETTQASSKIFTVWSPPSQLVR